VNFLAHLLLSAHDEEEMVGNLMGDFLRAGEESTYNDTFRRGIVLHRKIDAFTDAHPCFMQSRHRIAPELRRYAGIIVDLFYDHFLASNFEHHHDETLEDFTNRVYKLLRHYEPILPPRLQAILPPLMANNWLLAYRSIEGTRRALDGISRRRLRRYVKLDDSVAQLRDDYEGFGADFEAFFPKLREFAAEERQKLLG